MTPILIIVFGISPIIAVGTDLLYASITKMSGVFFHHKKHNVNWGIVGTLSLGSLPSCITTLYLMHNYNISMTGYNVLISKTLSVMLILTAIVILFKTQINQFRHRLLPALENNRETRRYRTVITVLCGVFLGCVVSISSVGAGAIGTALLFLLYPGLSAIKIIGTDLAHAVPLTAVAGLGHFSNNHVSLPLLSGLLLGGIPMVYIGSQIGRKLSDQTLRNIVATMLFALGLKLAFY